MDRRHVQPLDTPPPDCLMLEYRGYIGEVFDDEEAGLLHAPVVNSGS